MDPMDENLVVQWIKKIWAPCIISKGESQIYSKILVFFLLRMSGAFSLLNHLSARQGHI